MLLVLSVALLGATASPFGLGGWVDHTTHQPRTPQIVLVPISHTLHTESTLRFSTTHSHHHTKIADVIISNLIINLLRVPCSKFLNVGIIARRGPTACSLPTRFRIHLYGHLLAEVVTKRSRSYCGNNYESRLRVYSWRFCTTEFVLFAPLIFS